jgi:hypothetical protein
MAVRYSATTEIEAGGGVMRDKTLANSIWLRVLSSVQRIEDSWIGDLIGVVSLFGILFMMLFLLEVFR